MNNSDNKTAQNIQLSGLQKLDHFILGADIALLGWTVVNTDWIPKQNAFIVWLVGTFWVLIILSVISGVIRQIFIAEFLRYDNLSADYEGRGMKNNQNAANTKMDFTENVHRYSGYFSISFLLIALTLLAGIGITKIELKMVECNNLSKKPDDKYIHFIIETVDGKKINIENFTDIRHGCIGGGMREAEQHKKFYRIQRIYSRYGEK